ncbi:MAG: aminotransferase class V-fold PLP-dependent enzyme [Coriobacteriaceae bacterium]
MRRGVSFRPSRWRPAGRERRSSTENVRGIVGFARAARLAVDELAPSITASSPCATMPSGASSRNPSAKLNGSWRATDQHVNFSFEFIEGEGMLLQLAARGICVSSGSACTSGSLDPSHVLLAIGLPHEIAHGSLRLTLGRDTTLEDVDFAVDSLKATLQNLRMMSPLYEDFQQGKVESVIERFKADGFPYAN